MNDETRPDSASLRGFWDELSILLLSAIIGAIAELYFAPLPRSILIALGILSVMAWLTLQFGKRFRDKSISSARLWGISLTLGLVIGAFIAANAVPVIVSMLTPQTTSQGPCPSSLDTLPNLRPLHVGNVADVQELAAMDVSGVLAVAVPGDGQRFAVATRQGMCLYEWTTRRGSFLLFQTPVTTAAFSPDGRLLAVGSGDGYIGVWDTQPVMEVRWRVRIHQAAVTSLAFSPDGRLLASTGGDLTIGLREAQSGSLESEFDKRDVSLTSVMFGPEGMLASARSDGKIELWNLNTRGMAFELAGHLGAVTALAVSADGEQFVSGSKDKTVLLWNIREKEGRRRFRGHSDWVNSLAMSPDGRLMISGGEDHTIRIWELETGTALRVMTGHSAGVNALALSPTANLLISSSADGTVRLWGVPAD